MVADPRISQAPSRRPRWLLRIPLLALTGWFLILIGCGNSDSTETVTVTEPAGDASSPTPTDEAIGEPGTPLTVDLSETNEGELTVTLLGSDFDPAPPEPPEVYPLKNGHSWASVELTVANRASVVSRQSAIEYLLVAEDGTRVTAYDSNAFEPVISCCGSGYDGDTMQPGDKATGFVAFQVPNGVEPTRLRASDVLGTSAAEWSLDASTAPTEPEATPGGMDDASQGGDKLDRGPVKGAYARGRFVCNKDLLAQFARAVGLRSGATPEEVAEAVANNEDDDPPGSKESFKLGCIAGFEGK